MMALRAALLAATLATGVAGTGLAAAIDTTTFAQGMLGGVGAPNTATVGQTFTPDATQTKLTGFSLFLGSRFFSDAPLDLRGYLATWDGDSAATILYESGTRTKAADDTLQEFAFSLNQTLIAGQAYVAFLSVSNLPAQPFANFRMPLSPASALPDGRLVTLNNGTNFAALTTDVWGPDAFSPFFARDAWFRASFAPVPEPASLALLGAGLAGLLLARHRRR